MHIFSFEIAYKRMLRSHCIFILSRKGAEKVALFWTRFCQFAKIPGKWNEILTFQQSPFLGNALLSVKSFCYETGAVLYSTPSNSTKTISKIKYHILKFSRVFSNIIFWLSKEAARLLELFFSKIHATPLLRMYF